MTLKKIKSLIQLKYQLFKLKKDSKSQIEKESKEIAEVDITKLDEVKKHKEPDSEKEKKLTKDEKQVTQTLEDSKPKIEDKN
jgi:hypothetical protein